MLITLGADAVNLDDEAEVEYTAYRRFLVVVAYRDGEYIAVTDRAYYYYDAVRKEFLHREYLYDLLAEQTIIHRPVISLSLKALRERARDLFTACLLAYALIGLSPETLFNHLLENRDTPVDLDKAPQELPELLLSLTPRDVVKFHDNYTILDPNAYRYMILMARTAYMSFARALALLGVKAELTPCITENGVGVVIDGKCMVVHRPQ